MYLTLGRCNYIKVGYISFCNRNAFKKTHHNNFLILGIFKAEGIKNYLTWLFQVRFV